MSPLPPSMTRAMTMTRLAPLCALALACSVSDPSLLDPLRDDGMEGDMGQSEDDSGTPVDMGPVETRLGAPECPRAGETFSGFVLADTTTGIIVDTNGSSNTMVNCTESSGSDVFFGVDAVGGQPWHFHLTSISGADPVLYLLDSACDGRECGSRNANFCTGSGEEHFSFVPPATGRWYLGIDSAEAGGGVFRLDAYRPICDGAEKTHGEACDTNDPTACMGAGCDGCRCRVTPTSSREKGANDNLSEANQIDLQGETSMAIQGGLGGSGCGLSTYPDMYTIVLDAGQDLSVQLQGFGGATCTSAADLPIRLSLLTSTGDVAAPSGTDANGCSMLDAPNLGAGRYFIQVTDIRPEERTQLAYQLDLTVAN